jgi:hypothetical protein
VFLCLSVSYSYKCHIDPHSDDEKLYDRRISSEIYIIKIKAICVDHGYVTPSSIKVRILSGECGIFSLVQDIPATLECEGKNMDDHQILYDVQYNGKLCG